MPRVCVDKQTGTTAVAKKYVDNECLIWFMPSAVAYRPVENRGDMHETRLNPEMGQEGQSGFPV